MREWVTFPDPRRRDEVWQVDVTFLTSHWDCIFGRGCQGVLTEPAPELVQGCCSYGAHFSNRKDRDHTARMAKKLGDDEWQFAAIGRAKGIYAQAGKDEWRTRLVDGACIFLNRPGYPTGPGCALHQHAMRIGVHFSETKPEVCWQLPLRKIDEEDEDADDGVTIHRLTEFARHGWGEGGAEFAWWCTEAPEAFTGAQPVYRSMETELRTMCGDELYEQIAAYLDAHLASGPAPILHPAETPVTLGPTRSRASARPGSVGSARGSRP